MGGWDGSRPPTDSKFAGHAAEVWQGEAQIGLLYEWSVQGRENNWAGEAARYCFQKSAVGEVSIRFFVRVGGDWMELRGRGHVMGKYAADGVTHRQPLKLKGTALAVA